MSVGLIFLRARDHLLLARLCFENGNDRGCLVHFRAAMKARKLAKQMRRELAVVM